MVLLHGHCRLKDNITMALSDTGWEGMDWTDLAQDTNKWCPVLNNVLSLHVPLYMEKIFTHQRSTGFSRQPLLCAIGWLVGYLLIYIFSLFSNIPSKSLYVICFLVGYSLASVV
jgi:hypothetical protein